MTSPASDAGAPEDPRDDGTDAPTIEDGELYFRVTEALEQARAAGRSIDAAALAREHALDEARVRGCLRALEALDGALAGQAAAPRSAAPPTMRPPAELPDDYEVLGELGRGGMGVVYRVRQRSLDRTVALKMLRPDELVYGQAVERFRREAQALAKLRHRHIVTIYEVGDAGGYVYYTMDLVEGASLKALIGRGEVPPVRACTLLRQIASAIAYSHARGIIHRDLKPQNILIDEAGEAYVADFGLARDLAASEELTQTGNLLGTPAYMSPEQASGGAEAVTERSDVYALGAILYECLTGQPPHAGGHVAQVIYKVLHDEPPRPRALRKGLPKDLETICLKALDKRPERRYPTAKALLEDLERFEDGRPIRAAPPSLAYRARRFVGRRWLGLTAAAAVLTAVGFGLAALWIPGPAEAARRIHQALEQARALEAEGEVTAAASVRARTYELMDHLRPDEVAGGTGGGWLKIRLRHAEDLLDRARARILKADTLADAGFEIDAALRIASETRERLEPSKADTAEVIEQLLWLEARAWCLLARLDPPASPIDLWQRAAEVVADLLNRAGERFLAGPIRWGRAEEARAQAILHYVQTRVPAIEDPEDPEHEIATLCLAVGLSDTQATHRLVAWLEEEPTQAATLVPWAFEAASRLDDRGWIAESGRLSSLQNGVGCLDVAARDPRARVVLRHTLRAALARYPLPGGASNPTTFEDFTRARLADLPARQPLPETAPSLTTSKDRARTALADMLGLTYDLPVRLFNRKASLRRDRLTVTWARPVPDPLQERALRALADEVAALPFDDGYERRIQAAVYLMLSAARESPADEDGEAVAFDYVYRWLREHTGHRVEGTDPNAVVAGWTDWVRDDFLRGPRAWLSEALGPDAPLDRDAVVEAFLNADPADKVHGIARRRLLYHLLRLSVEDPEGLPLWPSGTEEPTDLAELVRQALRPAWWEGAEAGAAAVTPSAPGGEGDQPYSVSLVWIRFVDGGPGTAAWSRSQTILPGRQRQFRPVVRRDPEGIRVVPGSSGLRLIGTGGGPPQSFTEAPTQELWLDLALKWRSRGLSLVRPAELGRNEQRAAIGEVMIVEAPAEAVWHDAAHVHSGALLAFASPDGEAPVDVEAWRVKVAAELRALAATVARSDVPHEERTRLLARAEALAWLGCFLPLPEARDALGALQAADQAHDRVNRRSARLDAVRNLGTYLPARLLAGDPAALDDPAGSTFYPLGNIWRGLLGAPYLARLLEATDDPRIRAFALALLADEERIEKGELPVAVADAVLRIATERGFELSARVSNRIGRNRGLRGHLRALREPARLVVAGMAAVLLLLAGLTVLLLFRRPVGKRRRAAAALLFFGVLIASFSMRLEPSGVDALPDPLGYALCALAAGVFARGSQRWLRWLAPAAFAVAFVGSIASYVPPAFGVTWHAYAYAFVWPILEAGGALGVAFTGLLAIDGAHGLRRRVWLRRFLGLGAVPFLVPMAEFNGVRVYALVHEGGWLYWPWLYRSGWVLLAALTGLAMMLLVTVLATADRRGSATAAATRKTSSRGPGGSAR